MVGNEAPKRSLVLDPVERVSEIIYGVLMAVTFTGSLSVATARSEEIGTMLAAAFGCNLAWGLTDAVMYLGSTATQRHRRVMLLQQLQVMQDKHEAHRLIADALPERLAAGADENALEALRRGLRAVPVPAAGLGVRDYLGAAGVFGLVVVATLPVVIPFMVLDDSGLALRVSNVLALVTLFAGGFFLGHYTGGSPWRHGLAMTAIGVALVAIIIGLGG